VTETTEVILPADLAESLRVELGPEERLFWCAQPRPSLFLRRAIPILLAFPLGMGGSAIAFLVGISNRGDPMQIGLFLAIELSNAGFLTFLALMVWHSIKRTVYAVTDRRAIVLVEGVLKRRLLLGPAEVSTRRVTRRTDGSGDIRFLPAPGAPRRGRMPRGSGFYAIDDVDRIEALLLDLAAKHSTVAEGCVHKQAV